MKLIHDNKAMKLGLGTLVTLAGLTVALAQSPRVFAQNAQAEVSTTPSAAEVPAEIPAGSIAVRGIACVDADHNGLCTADEARIPGLLIIAGDQVASTDNTGAYQIVVPDQTLLEITVPQGYRSLNGDPRIQIFAAERVDFPLSLEVATAPTTPAQPAIQRVEVNLPKDFVQPVVNLGIDMKPVYLGIAALAGISLLGYLLIGGMLGGMRRVYKQSLVKQDAALADQHTREISLRLQEPTGWQTIAEQIIADAIWEVVSINPDAGVLNASAAPAPKFTLVARDGREFTFTIAPGTFKKSHQLKRGDKIVNITNVSATSRMDVMMLWEHILRTRNMQSATPPSRAQWYVVVKQAPTSEHQIRINPGRTPLQIGRPS